MNLHPPAPPRPPKPGHVKVLRALYKYTAQYPDELSFEEGDVLYVTGSVADPNWVRASCGNHSGLIPCNYVTENVELIETPLHDAAKRGNLNFLKECLNNGVSVNSLDKAGNTALYWASHTGHLECLIPLLQSPNIDLNVQNKIGDTALHAAAWKGRIEAVVRLLESGADIIQTNNEGKTALEVAKDPQIIDLILKHQDTDPNGDGCEDYFGGDDGDSD